MKRAIEKIKLFFNNLFKTKLTTASNNEVKDESIELYRKNLQAIRDTWFGDASTDVSFIKTVHSHIHIVLAENFRQAGFFNGKKGARDYNIEKTANANATLLCEGIQSKLTGRLEDLKYNVDMQDLSIEREKLNLDLMQKQYTGIHAEEYNDEKQFSRFQASMYIFFALAMVISDIVVSLNLVGFFGIGKPDPGDGTKLLKEKLLDGELFWFALGIAFCTIFFKIMYDDYISIRMGSYQREKNRLNKEDISTKFYSLEFSLRLFIKLIILGGLILFLYNLSKFRTYFSIEKQDDINSLVEAMAANKGSEDIKQIILNSFIGISILVPIISGISLSMGMRILGRRKMMKKSGEDLVKSKNDLKNLIDRNSDYKSDRAELDKFHQEWSNLEKKIKNISTTFINHYNQGYRQGFKESNHADLYLIVEEYRNEHIHNVFSKKITDHYA